MAVTNEIDLSQAEPQLKDLGLPDDTQGVEAQGGMPMHDSGLSMLDRPIPGQSLTNDPNARMPFESKPKITNRDEAVDTLFSSLTAEENITEVLDLLRRELPVEDIAQTFLFEMFRTGAITPDLMLSMIEPTIHALIFIADYADIEVVISEENDMSSSKSEEGKKISKRLQGLSEGDLGGETPLDLTEVVKQEGSTTDGI